MADLIYRQAAIDALDGEINIAGRVNAQAVIDYVSMVKDRLERLPSAEPERKIGSWVTDDEFIDCSICRREKWSRVPYENLVKRFRYCPNCGAKMEEGDEE